MRIVCWQTIVMKYHTLFFSKIRKDVEKKMWFAAVVIGALRVKSIDFESPKHEKCLITLLYWK